MFKFLTLHSGGKVGGGGGGGGRRGNMRGGGNLREAEEEGASREIFKVAETLRNSKKISEHCVIFCNRKST